MNHLYFGDCLHILKILHHKHPQGFVDLIYIDPPFDTGADFSFNATVPEPDDGDADLVAFTKQPSIIEQKAYRDRHQNQGRQMDRLPQARQPFERVHEHNGELKSKKRLNAR